MNSNANSHVNRIPGVSIDGAGFITTQYGRYHPVTGQGLDFDIPDDLWNTILGALIQDGIDSGPAEKWDIDKWFAEFDARHRIDPSI